MEKDVTSATASINADMVGNYLRQMQDVSRVHGIAMDGADVWSVLVRMPDVVQTVAVEELSEEEWQEVFALVKVAAEELMQSSIPCSISSCLAPGFPRERSSFRFFAT